jgi:hypothetical protein
MRVTQYGAGLIVEQLNNFRTLLHDDFLELLGLVDSPHVNPQWHHTIETSCPMKRQHLHILVSTERAEVNRELKDAVEGELFSPESQ